MVKIIDFGLVTRFQDNDGKYLKPHLTDYFQGNMWFSSFDQMK